MTATEYFTHHLGGAWRLLWGDADGLEDFDLSDVGFQRSFWAIMVAFVLLLPNFAADHHAGVSFAAQAENVKFDMPLSVYLATEVTVNVIGWAVFLILMVPVARAFGVSARYSRYVIAYNWMNLLTVILVLPLAALELLGFVSWDLALLAQLLLGLIFLVYSWFVAKIALGLKGLDAAAVVALETLIFVILSYPAEGLYARYG